MWAPGSNDPIYRPRRNEDPVPRWKYNGVCALAWILGALLRKFPYDEKIFKAVNDAIAKAEGRS
jgi:hypothetical protein